MSEYKDYIGTAVPGRNKILRTLDVLMESSKSVWVDAEYGDNSTGEVDRFDRPFAGIRQAFQTLSTSLVNGETGTVYVANGNYVLTQQMSSSSGKNITIKCESRLGVVVDVQTIRAIGGASIGDYRTITLIGGTWNRTVASGQPMFWENPGRNIMRFIGCNVNDIAGTGGAIFLSATLGIEDCHFTSVVGQLISGGGLNYNGELYIKNSRFEALSNDLGLRDIGTGQKWDNCFIKSYTSRLNSTGFNDPQDYFFKDCTLESFLEGFNHAAGLAINYHFLGKCTAKVETDVRFIVLGSTNVNRKIVIDNLIINQPDGATSPGIGDTAGQITTLVVLNQLLMTTPLISTVTPRAGATLPATPTIGNTITMNLPNVYSTAPIVYVVGSTNPATETANMKALIDAQVTTPGTPWNAFTAGNTAKVLIIGNGVYVEADESAPTGYSILTSGTYFTDTAAELTKPELRTARGFVNKGPGDIQVAFPQELLLGGGERVVDAIDNKLKTKYI